jgi:hypothetical protein
VNQHLTRGPSNHSSPCASTEYPPLLRQRTRVCLNELTGPTMFFSFFCSPLTPAFFPFSFHFCSNESRLHGLYIARVQGSPSLFFLCHQFAPWPWPWTWMLRLRLTFSSWAKIYLYMICANPRRLSMPGPLFLSQPQQSFQRIQPPLHFKIKLIFV